MTQSVSVAIVSSVLMKLGKRRHNLSSLMTHDLSFAWLPAPQPPWPMGHFGGSQTRPALSFTPGGRRGAVTHRPCGAGGGIWPVLTAPCSPCSGPLPPLGYCSSLGPGCLCLQSTHSSQKDALTTSRDHITAPQSHPPPAPGAPHLTLPCAKSLQGCLNVCDPFASVVSKSL